MGPMIPKEMKYNLHYGKVRGDVLSPPHDTKLRKLFNDYIAARERADQQSYSGLGETKYSLPRQPMGTTEALISGTRMSPRSNNRHWNLPSCRYCNGSHWSDECLKYVTAESRKQRIRGCCILCLKPGRRTRNVEYRKPVSTVENLTVTTGVFVQKHLVCNNESQFRWQMSYRNMEPQVEQRQKMF